MIYQVLLPLALDRPFSYTSHENIPVGQLVIVPFRGSQMTGVIWTQEETSYQGELKPIIQTLPWHFTLEMRQFLTWVADYNLAIPGTVLKMALPSHATKIKQTKKALSITSISSPSPPLHYLKNSKKL